MIFVAFSDSTKSTIVAIFGCAQDPNYWPNQGQVGSNDARYATYFNAQTASVQPYLPSPSSS